MSRGMMWVWPALAELVWFTAGTPAFGEAAQVAAPTAWDAAVVQSLSTLPVQDEGRVKPLSTYAGFRLLKLNGKREVVVGRERLTPMAWLLDTLFYPEKARTYKVFLVHDSAAMDRIGVAHEGKGKRDRYSYDELAPGRAELMRLAQQYSAIEPKARQPLEAQIVNLAMNLLDFEHLAGYFDFARADYPLQATPHLATLFPEVSDTPFAQAVGKGQVLNAAFTALREGTVEGVAEDTRSAEMDAIRGLLTKLDDEASHADALALLPPNPDAGSTAEWFSPSTLLNAAFLGDAPVDRQVALLASLERVGRSANDAGQFREAVTRFHDEAVALAKERGEYGAIPLETLYYRLDLLYWALGLFVLSFVVVAVSWFAPGSPLLYRLSRWAVVPPIVLLVAAITMRCIIRGRPPVSTLYETILFITAVAAVCALAMEYINRRKVAVAMATILGSMGLFLAYKYEIKEGVDTMPSLIAVLDTNFWLATHVTTVTMGYSAGLLASAIAHVYIFSKFLGVRRNDPSYYQSIMRMTYGAVCFGLVFGTLGTVLGGVWANDSWGRFWGWDPKENGALMIVLWGPAVVHARAAGDLGPWGIHLSAAAGSLIVAWSWFGVNLLGVGLHSYGFTSGLHRALLFFYVFEAGVLAAGAVARLREPAATPAP